MTSLDILWIKQFSFVVKIHILDFMRYACLTTTNKIINGLHNQIPEKTKSKNTTSTKSRPIFQQTKTFVVYGLVFVKSYIQNKGGQQYTSADFWHVSKVYIYRNGYSLNHLYPQHLSSQAYTFGFGAGSLQISDKEEDALSGLRRLLLFLLLKERKHIFFAVFYWLNWTQASLDFTLMNEIVVATFSNYLQAPNK